MKFYVDGQLDANSATTNLAVNTDVANGIPVRISRGINNRYFTGEIDDVRIWETALSQASIQEWMRRKVNSTHPDYANLKLYYLFDEGNGTSINDLSANNNDASVVNGAVWMKAIGEKLFKSFVEAGERPNTTFIQGTYNTTITNNPVDLPVEQTPHVIIERSVISNSGITSDGIASAMPVNYWNAATGQRYYDENEMLINTIPVSPYDSLIQVNLNYWSRSPMTFEIMSFVTPYGINLDLGPAGKTWTFDVTDFTPILKGSKRMVMKAGCQWQEDMDIRFLFIVGTPPKDVLDISQIWKADRGSTTGANIQNESVFPSRDVLFMNNASSFKIRSSITGHGQQGEFVAQTHFIDLNGGNKEFSWQVWKECAENPVYPQGGTWIYDRAGWCPGMATDIKEMDITQYVTPGQTHSVDYGISSNPGGDSRYIISNQLVSYGAPNHVLDARVLDIQRPTGKVEHARLNPMCYAPQVVIQNTGSTALTSATIEYWVNNAAQKETFNWTGNLSFMGTAVIDLPVSATLWNSIAGATGNKFHAKVKNPNGGTDEYAFNDEQYAVFNITDVMPRKFVVNYTSNKRPAETKIKILDASGNAVYTNTLTTSQSTSNDTISLGLGCFSLLVTDSGEDGLDFFANRNQVGTGALSFRKEDGAVIKQFEPNFGKSLLYNFTVGFPLSFEELENANALKVYPNPAANELTVELKNGDISRIDIVNMLGQKIQAPAHFVSGKKVIINTSLISSGIYSLQTESNGKIAIQKIVIQH